ncbi:MAG: CHAT domain-containing tetratricopeptide repeat protein [Bacteroidia bacterium]|nr:CHAT domain-containing tetratricopeptide repeat protein [Bacteroidia bacterium]
MCVSYKHWGYWVLLVGMFACRQGPVSASRTISTPDLLTQSRYLSAEGYFDSAYAVAQAAWHHARATQDTALLAGALLERGKYLVRSGYAEDAIPVLDSLLALVQVVGNLHPVMLAGRGERADAAYLAGLPEEHLARYRALAADCAALPPEADSLRGVMYQWVGQAYLMHDSLETALKYLQESLVRVTQALPPDHLQIAYSHNALAIIHRYQGEPERARHHLEQALAIFLQRLRPDHSHLIQVRSNLAALYLDNGLMWEAITLLEQNLPLVDRLSPQAQYSSFYNYATARNTVGDYHTTLAYLDRAEALVQARPGLRPDAGNQIAYLRAAAYENLHDYDAALRFVREGIRIYAALHGSSHPALMTDYLREGTILHHMQRYPEAVTVLKEALRLAQRQKSPDAMRIGWAWESLGEVYLAQQNYAEALTCFRQAAPLYSHPLAQWNRADTYSHMAQAWLGLQQPDSNWYYVQKAWQQVLPELPFQVHPDSQVSTYWHRQTLMNTLQTQAEGLHARALRAGSDGCPDALAAVACLQTCIVLADSQAFYVEMPGSRQVIHASRTALIAKLAAWEQDFARLGSCYTSQGAEIFRLAEAGKAVALREHLRGQAVPHLTGVPDSLRAHESRLRQRLAVLAQADPLASEDPAAQSGAAADFLTLRQEYRQLISQIRTRYPAYYQLCYAAAAPALNVLQQRLTPRQVIYSYLITGDSLLVFLVQRDQFRMYSLPASALSLIRRWQVFVSQPPAHDTPDSVRLRARDAYALSRQLLPDMPPNVAELILIPDGILHSFPFETLLTHPEEHTDYRSWPFLGREKAVTYVHATELWVQPANQQAVLPSAYTGFAPGFEAVPGGTVRSTLTPLRYSQQEVNQAAAGMRGRALTGMEASEAMLKHLRHHPLLHLATHAIMDEEQPMQSRLYLAPDSAAGEDGVLYAHEIYNLRLQSPLAVLSACETGTGKAEQGEGLKSLARAFQYAGCQQLVTTRWQADDQATAELIPAFFAGLGHGTRTSTALLQARQSYLSGSDYYHAHPYFWAHLMLIGDGEPVTPPRWRYTLQWGLWLLLLAGMVAAGSWWMHTARTRKKT